MDHPDDLAKHNEVRTTIKNSNLSKFFTKNPTTRPLFAFAERDYNGWDLEDVIPKSFVNRVPGWLRVTELPYWQLRKEYLKHHEEDEVYKSFSEVFSRLVGERLVQPSVSNNVQNQQKDGPPSTETIVLNDPSSGDKGPADNADT